MNTEKEIFGYSKRIIFFGTSAFKSLKLKNKSKINFLKFNKYALVLSISLMILSSVLILIKGLNLGIDFVGGARIDFSIKPQWEEEITINSVKKALNNFISDKNYSIKKNY